MELKVTQKQGLEFHMNMARPWTSKYQLKQQVNDPWPNIGNKKPPWEAASGFPLETGSLDGRNPLAPLRVVGLPPSSGVLSTAPEN
jgi:hypothetical protein